MSDRDYTSDEITTDDFSLEAILAEYKGSAFINGDKKTPPELLNEQAERILKEAAGNIATESRFSADTAKRVKDTLREVQFSAADDAQKTVVKRKDDVRPAKAEREIIEEPPVQTRDTEERPPKNTDENDNAVLFFDNYRSTEQDQQDTIVRDVEKAIERELGYKEEPRATETRVFKKHTHYDFDEGDYAVEEEEFEEPDLRDAASRFAMACNSISLRCIPAGLISLVMVIMTLAFEAGLIIPFGIGNNLYTATGSLMLGMLIVMILCADIIDRGFSYLIRGAPNAETLILFSCAFSFISAAFTILSGASAVLPYCAISALSLTLAAFGEKFNLRAITETLKTAAASSEPYGLQAEYIRDIDKSVLKKAYNRTDGFYNNLMHADVTETAYRYAAPVLLAVSLVLSVFIVLVKGGGEYFLHILSALLAAAAPFSLMLSFSVPFGTVARSIRRSGAAIAGWGGADDVCFSDGACVTDEDLFPPGTLSLNGLKLFDGASPEKAIRYTASLIMASGSGLSNLFSDVLKTQAMNVIRVEDFACYDGGVGALIRGERVASGSAAFMNLLGVRVPDDTNMKNAVYTAVNNRLIAMFTVDYTPINSVQSALISIMKWRIKLFLAVRDFNVTPLMLEQKFRVSLDGIEYIQAKDSYTISDSKSGNQGRMAAVLIREGLGPFAEAVTGGRLLKSAALVATAVSVISAAFGVLIMFFMCWSGAFSSAKPGNLLLFMLSMLAVVLIVCFYVKCKK